MMIATKICGVKTLELMNLLLVRNIQYIGMIFAESNRKIPINTLEQCNQYLKNTNAQYTASFVAVFMNQPLDEVINTLAGFPFTVVQLHGEESIGYCKKLKKQFPTIKIIKSLPIPFTIIDENAMLQDINKKISYYRQVVDGFLFDTKKGNQSGGTGSSFPWGCVKPIVDNPFRNYQIGIAGGLSPENITNLLEQLSPDFVDINSGVEINGEKDIKEIDRLLKLLEDHNNETYQTN